MPKFIRKLLSLNYRNLLGRYPRLESNFQLIRKSGTVYKICWEGWSRDRQHVGLTGLWVGMPAKTGISENNPLFFSSYPGTSGWLLDYSVEIDCSIQPGQVPVFSHSEKSQRDAARSKALLDLLARIDTHDLYLKSIGDLEALKVR